MKRCPDDTEQPDLKLTVAIVGDKPVVLDGMETVVRYHLDSAFMGLSVLMQSKEGDAETDDTIARLAVSMLGLLMSDPHCLCPLQNLLEDLNNAYDGGQVWWKDGKLRVEPPTAEELGEALEKREAIRQARRLYGVQSEVVEQRAEDKKPQLPPAGVPEDGGEMFEKE